jgi:hypothetical protein
MGQQQPGPMQGPPGPMQGPGGPMGPAQPSWFKRNLGLIAVAGFFCVQIFTSWVVGAFDISDKDIVRFFHATGMAAATSGMALLLLTAFQRATDKDKEHPAGVGVSLLAIALVLALGIFGAGLAMSKLF